MWASLRYPNIELLEYKVSLMLSKDKVFSRKYIDEKEKRGYAYTEMEAMMFPQIWGSTCTGFDITENGEPAIGGSAMTKEYTTVFHELVTDIYVVCFGEKPCYMVHDATEIFLDDLRRQQMRSLSQAKTTY